MAALRFLGSRIPLTSLLLLAACAHAPAPRPASTTAVIPPTSVTTSAGDRAANASAGATQAATVPAASSAPSPSAAAAAVVPGNAAGASAQDNAAPSAGTVAAGTAQPVAGLNPANYADLLDRMRAGFRLGDMDRTAVDDQLNWFVANPDYVQRAFQRSELYLYHIVTEIESRGMPLELALLPVIESAYEPYAYSRARASGLWQFIPGTGSRFGLKQNWWYDGRRDVMESTRAALEYLQALHDEFNGDWLLAIAAYNCGELAVAKAVQTNQQAGRPIDFWSLRLPVETRAYVPKLLAMKRLVADPEAHGLSFSRIPNQAYFTRVETQGQIDLRVAAEIAGITYEELYELNPAFHRWATDPSGPHFLLLPADAANAFRSNLMQLSPDERLKVKHYFVHRGDTMAAIARHSNTSPQALRELNDLPSGPLVVGTDLRVPSDAVTLPAKVLRAAALVDGHDHRVLRSRVRIVVRRGDSLWAIARRHGVDVHALALLNGMQPGDPLRAGQRLKLVAARSGDDVGSVPAAAAPHARRLTYTVRTGDTLARIARVFQVSVPQIVSWNSLEKTALAPGQRLLIRLVRP